LTQENTNASFYAAIDVGDFAEVSEMSAVVAADGFVVLAYSIMLADDVRSRGIASKLAKREKRNFLAGILQCPFCNHSIEPGPHCPHCSTNFTPNTSAINTVDPATFAIPHAINTSFCVYDRHEQNAILETKARGDYILDFGAGLPLDADPWIINLEIADLPSTDIISLSDRLPFRDNTFGAIISLHVLEHVPRPWVVSAEFHRVLKPGGLAVVTVPYICEVHGFPHHYFNPTPFGLRSLFEKMRVISHDVKGDAHPINSLQQVLRPYLQGLPEDVRLEFKKLTVEQLMADSLSEALHRSYCMNLSAETRWLIPSHTTLTVQKE
jgi:SAM-dependent methyltransferase